ncbi:hypothetical protein ACFSOZ_11625 [Mesorhizobium newzealandense]|uniref:Uncharacterized protein n=1 Tax=Mesorhizobium newzealandense TaxID=1300302 RepID=A0ABW4U8K4_9HYPH
MALVIAKKGSIASARDVIITVNIHLNTPPTSTNLANLISTSLQADPDAVSSVGPSPADERSVEEVVTAYLMMASSSAALPDNPYEKQFAGIDELRILLRTAIGLFKSHAYLKAHDLFRQALASDYAGDLKSRIVYDYLVSGYVGYSLASDTEGIRQLIASVQSAFAGYIDRSTELAMAEAHQEVATRQTADDMLFENKGILAELLNKFGPDDIACLNLQGLLYRRLGERKSSGGRRKHFLELSRSIFDHLASLELNLSVEHSNNRAITLIRLYELTGDAMALAEAETILSGIDYRVTSLPLADFLALPKALNNHGNVWKQKLQANPDADSYTSAVENYSRAERYWNEQQSPYEWAMLQKNKADVRCVYMKIFGLKKATFERAMTEIIDSLKYRSPDHAPYQYERSMEVKRELEKLLA